MSAALVGIAMLTVHGPSFAEPDASDSNTARRMRVVLTVGAHKVTVGELEDAIATIPPYQMSMFGASREEVARAFINQVLVRDLVLAAGAEERHLDQQLPTSQIIARSLSSTTLRKSHAATTSTADVSTEDVQRYYTDNLSRFDSPQRVNLWRILCKTQEEANTVIDEARRNSSTEKWGELARVHSIDKATNLRSGNLGFLAPDGASNEAGVKVDAALVTAAQSAKDGELIGKPIPEGSAFAVVWRRGTVPAMRRTVEESSAQIRSAIYRERTETAEKKLIDELKAKNLKEVNPGLLGVIELRPFDAGLGAPRNPAGSLTPAPRSSK